MNSKNKLKGSKDLAAKKNEISRDIARVAARWLMQVHRDQVSEDVLKSCEQWRKEDSLHEEAWQRAINIQAKLELIPTETAIKILDREARPNRRDLFKKMFFLITVAPASYITYNTQSWQFWTANYSTDKGQQRQITLADGSKLHLNTDTYVDIEFTERQRLIVLHQGEILIETGKQNTNPFKQIAPFIVKTSQGRLQPIGTRFIVRKFNKKPLVMLSVLEGVVEVKTQLGTSHEQVKSGQQVLLSADKITKATPIFVHADTWSKGFFYAKNMRLENFLQEINRYRLGILRCDPKVASLLISGVFQISNTDHILSALPQTLPVSIVYKTAYWVTVKAAKNIKVY